MAKTKKTISSSSPSPILAAARDYLAMGWALFPLHTIDPAGQCTCGVRACSDAGKHPRVQRGVKEASRDAQQIEAWFGPAAPPSNIGLATGTVSGITVLDIDIGEGKFGAESWADAIAEHGEPNTLMARTGSGGMHVFFKYNSVLKTAANVLGKGVDSRNDGGYVVAAPSKHRSGGVYAWENWGTPLADLPPHLSRKKELRGRPKHDDLTRRSYTLEQIADMLAVIPSDDRDLWRYVGIILGRAFNRIDTAWELYVAWADKDAGKKGRGHDAIMRECFYDLSQTQAERSLSIGTIVKAALDHGWVPKAGAVPIERFVFYGPGNNYIYRPTDSYWIAAAVDAAVSPVNVEGKLMRASDWLRKHALITSMTCDPSVDEDVIRGMDCRHGELIPHEGSNVFNTYRKPTITLGDATKAGPFLAHVEKVFNKHGDAAQFLDYMAHRVQRPWEKPRFALLIAGGQGVGKDTAVEMCCPAIGAWNVANIDPSAFDSAFNEFAASTLVRISEAANLHDMSRWAFNERTKVLIAGSPDVCAINPKYGQKFTVKMHCGVIITTNYTIGGLFIPQDDRRYDVIEAATMDEMALADEGARRTYFAALWDWFLDEGQGHVAAFLRSRNLAQFSPNNGQRKTAAHHAMVRDNLSGDAWLLTVLHVFKFPTFIREDSISTTAIANGERPTDVRNKMNFAMQRAGYRDYPSADPHGRWDCAGVLVRIYGKEGTAPGQDPRDLVPKGAF